MSMAHSALAGDEPGVTPPQEYLYSGVMDIRGQALTDLDDLNPGMVRLRHEESNPLGSWGSSNRLLTISRSADILESGAALMPCIETDGYSSKAAFTSDLAAWIDALDASAENPPLWWEIGNEPDTGGTQAQIRAKYLDYMTDARAVLSARGKKLILSAFIQASGGTQTMLNDINAGVGGAAFSQIDGMAIHPYTVQAATSGPQSGSYDSAQGYRNLFDSSPYNLDGKPMFITEIGWSCATRADDLQHGDWNGEVPEMLTTNISITQAQQAARLTTAFNDLKDHRGKSQLYLLAMIWFAYHDYGPSENWDRHCGFVDLAEGKRQVYATFKNYQRRFPIGA